MVEWWIYLGIGLLVLYWVKPDFFLFSIFKGKREEFEEGVYEIDPVYLFSNAILPPIIELKNGQKGTFVSFKPNKNNSWDLETDEFVIKNVDPHVGVNLKVVDVFAIMCGRGRVYCNKTPDGKVHQGWMGIGTPEQNILREKVRTLERQCADYKILAEETQQKHYQDRLKIAELEKEIEKTRGVRTVTLTPEQMEGGMA